MNYRSADAEARFKKYVDHSAGPNGCWIWTGSKSSTGYGHIKINRATVKAHRLSYMLAHGPIPDGLCVLHRCDVPLCVNPAHLFLGTNADNVRDRNAKGRARGNAKLTVAAVRDIRSRFAEGASMVRLASEYGVDRAAIRDAITGATWAHVKGAA